MQYLCRLVCILVASFAVSACGSDDPATPGANTDVDAGTNTDAGGADTGGMDDAGMPDTGGMDDAGMPDTGGMDDAGTPDTGGSDDAGSERSVATIVSEYTGACYDLCLLGSGCNEDGFEDLGLCEDDCDSDSGYFVGNAPDDAAGRACMEAILATDTCIAALDCDDFSIYWNTDSGDYPCAAEDASEDAACVGLDFYDNF